MSDILIIDKFHLVDNGRKWFLNSAFLHMLFDLTKSSSVEVINILPDKIVWVYSWELFANQILKEIVRYYYNLFYIGNHIYNFYKTFIFK